MKLHVLRRVFFRFEDFSFTTTNSTYGKKIIPEFGKELLFIILTGETLDYHLLSLFTRISKPGLVNRLFRAKLIGIPFSYS